MNQPLARAFGPPGHIITLTWPDIDRVGLEAPGRRQGLAVARDDLKRPAVDMCGMDEAVVGSDTADLEGLSYFHSDGVG